MEKNARIDFKDLKDRTKGGFGLVLAHYGLAPIGAGDQVRVTCPFHADGHEKHASCSINRAEGVWNCKAGSCGLSGNLLDFVQRLEALRGEPATLPHAARKLAAICGIELPGQNGAEARQKDPRAATAKEAVRPTSPGSDRVLAAPARENGAVPERNEPLHFTLAVVDHPYLRERGVPEALAATFGLTFAEKGIMAGRVCVPIHNPAGELVAYAGRWVGADEDIPEGEEKYKLPKGFYKNLELFNLHRVKRCRHLVVAEGFFGTIALHGHRVPAVGLMGSSISDAQIALLVEHCPNLRFVTVLLDGDEAGRKASKLVAGKLAWHWPVRIGALPQDMQPDTTPLPALMHAIGRDR